MAEEDLIYGKNRHFFGGIEPGDMTTFTANSEYDSKTDTVKVKIQASLPSRTIIDGHALNTIGGAVIRKKENDYPVDEFDGELIKDITTDSVLYDTDVTIDTPVYYAAFPYTRQGVYNRSATNRCQATPKKSYYFGYDISINEPNPEKRVTYPSDVENYGYTPAKMNFDTGVLNYGDWNFAPGEKFMPSPCMLGFDGVVKEYLNPNDYTKNINDESSSVSDMNSNANAMMEWPKIYTKRWEENGVYKFRCSNQKLDEGYECWCNYDGNDKEIDHFYTAIYNASRDSSSRIRSISGQTPVVSTLPSVFATQAEQNGSDWYVEVVADIFLIQDLLTMMIKTTNSSDALGYGYIPKNVEYPKSGMLDKNGLFYGKNEIYDVYYPKYHQKLFGMEDYIGTLYRMVAGLFCDKNVLKVKITKGKKDDSTVIGYSWTSSNGYITVSGITPLYSASVSGSGNKYGYLKKCKTMDWGRVPYDAGSGGSETTYECDDFRFHDSGLYASSYSTSVGGGISGQGIFNLPCANPPATASYNNTTVRLSCKPSTKGG